MDAHKKISHTTEKINNNKNNNFAYFSKYNVRRQTQHLSVPYYVKENFDSDYQGSFARLENSVEEDYIYTMKQHCFRERNYRELNQTI